MALDRIEPSDRPNKYQIDLIVYDLDAEPVLYDLQIKRLEDALSDAGFRAVFGIGEVQDD